MKILNALLTFCIAYSSIVIPAEVKRAAAKGEAGNGKQVLTDQLIEAASNGDTKNVLQLLKEGANINGKNELGVTALVTAISGDHYETVKTLLDNGADINMRTDNGLTALDIARSGAKDKIVELLMRKYSPQELLNIKLVDAANNEDLKTVDALLKEGANIDWVGYNNWTALQWAALRKNKELVLLLLKKGANPNRQDGSGRTALNEAVTGNALEIAKILLEYRANPDLGMPLLVAAWKHDWDMLKLLLKNGANINVQDSKGNTALMKAAESGNVEGVKILLEYGAFPYIQNKKGKTALDFAYKKSKNIVGMHKKQYEDIVELLTRKQPTRKSKAQAEEELKEWQQRLN